MPNRREFVGQVMGIAGAGLLPTARVLGANDRIRFALIGAGARGTEILRAAISCPNVEAVAVADVYTRRLEAVKKVIPNATQYRDFRKLLDDKTIDAVLIATPQHMHALNFVPAIQAGKDVYQEKTMAFNPEHARRMRHAVEGSGRVVQIGMQMNSGEGIQKIREMATPDRMGTITQIQAHHYRNAPYGGWMRNIPADCDEQHVDWAMFQGEAARHPFDPQRVMNWRFYWEYSGGNVFENMVHQVGFWYSALKLEIPRAVTMTGANYLSPKMVVPDAMNVTIELPEKMLFTWDSLFSNSYYGEGNDLLFGTKGTLTHDETDQVRYIPQARRHGQPAEEEKTGPKPGYHDFTKTHMQNFFDCVRSRKETVCPFDLGFRSAIVCRMAIESYRRGVTVRWDPQAEEIV